MDGNITQYFETAVGRIRAVKRQETFLQDGEKVRREYVEVFSEESTDLIAWFGDVAEFANWISEALVKPF